MNSQAIALVCLVLVLGWIIWKYFIQVKKVDVIPSSWKIILKDKVSFYRMLTPAEQKRFEKDVMRFLQVVTITGVETIVTDTDKVLVASSAVIPLFGFPNWSYRNISEVLLYKDTFNPKNYETDGHGRRTLGMVGGGNMNRLMILSKPALHRGFENKQGTENVGIHEFVHLLDKADGDVNGIPEVLLDHQYIIPWIKSMRNEISRIANRTSDINPYGATNDAEFLSVVSEYFFNQPKQLKRNHPVLFDLLEKMFNQDLA